MKFYKIFKLNFKKLKMHFKFYLALLYFTKIIKTNYFIV
jgi:hypothetical protein